jgi:hypothetical protein
MFKPMVRVALASTLLVCVAACGEKSATDTAVVAQNTSTPDGAIRHSAELLKAGDIAGLMAHSLPPADFAKAKADWSKDANETPITDEDRQKFAETMAKLTAPDAETALFAEIEPQLAAFDAQYQQQIPMYVAMGSGWLQGMVQQNKDMTEEAKQQAIAAINALAAWVQKTRFTDPASVKKVLAIASKAARDMNLKTLDEARALSFEQSMDKGRIAFLALKEALAVFGFSLDQTLDSVKPEVVSNDGKTAKVKVAYTLFDAPLAMETELVNLDGRWYGKEALEKLAEARAEAATPEAEVAPAAEAATPAAE